MENKPFYLDINDDDIEKYQRYFSQMLNTADIKNLTKWSQGLEYNRAEYDRSYEQLEPVLDKAEEDGLVPFNLQIMFEQYIFADVFKREKCKRRWVEKVINRMDEDFFPDPYAVRAWLEKNAK